MKSGNKDYSIVVPVYNSNENLDALIRDFEKFFIGNNYNADLVLVDDHSNEATRLKSEQAAISKPFIKTIRLRKNSGQLAATTCGIHHAAGNIILTMDDDLQYPMQEALNLIHHFEKSGKKIVFGYPRLRKRSLPYRILAQLVILLFNYIVLPRYREINFYTSFRIFHRSFFFDKDGKIISRHLFYLWEIPPDDMGNVAIEHQPRKTGSSNYSFRKITRHLLPPILITVLRLSSIFLVAIITAAIALFLLGKRQPYLLFVIISLIFFSAAWITAKALLKKKRAIEYEIEKITG